MKKSVLAIGCHPDDVEILCAGTLALLKRQGWQITIATMTNGNLGSATLTKDEISNIRKKEAATSAKLLDADYYCLENDDIFLNYDRETLLKTIDLIRKVKPDVVITQSQKDYMIDHEMTSKLVQTACFSAAIKNIETENENFDKIPHLYYMDALEGKDILGEKLLPTMIIDISETIDKKEEMLKCHESQRSWLMSHNGIDEYINAMRDFSALRGKEINTDYGEGFRQHLGAAYPQNNILKESLNEKVCMVNEK